jgi:hypothetical protein
MKHKQFFESRHIWKYLLSDNFPQKQKLVVKLSSARSIQIHAGGKLVTPAASRDKFMHSGSR